RRLLAWQEVEVRRLHPKNPACCPRLNPRPHPRLAPKAEAERLWTSLPRRMRSGRPTHRHYSGLQAEVERLEIRRRRQTPRDRSRTQFPQLDLPEVAASASHTVRKRCPA